jgi:Tol biopolymer transport system component
MRYAMILFLVLVGTAATAAGGHIAFTSNRDGNREIYVVAADGTGVLRLTNNKAYDDQPSLTPDGTQVVFCSNRDGNTELYVVGVDGKNLKRLTNTNYPEGDPSFAPDGQSILYTSMVEGDKDIWRYNLATGKSEKVIGGEGDQSMARELVDGAIVYVQGGGEEIMLWDGGAAKLLGGSPNLDTMPAPSPDGKAVYFVSNRKGDYDIYVINRDGTGERELVALPSLEGRPTPSPDGKYLALTSDMDGDLDIYVFTVAGEKVAAVTANDGLEDYEPSWGN